jgi:ribosomal protein S27AE
LYHDSDYWGDAIGDFVAVVLAVVILLAVVGVIVVIWLVERRRSEVVCARCGESGVARAAESRRWVCGSCGEPASEVPSVLSLLLGRPFTRQSSSPAQRDPPGGRTGSGEGDHGSHPTCRQCGKPILLGIERCPYCGAWRPN